MTESPTSTSWIEASSNRRSLRSRHDQTSLDVLRALAVALAVSADELVFDADERGPQDESLRLHLAALDQLNPGGQLSQGW